MSGGAPKYLSHDLGHAFAGRGGDALRTTFAADLAAAQKQARTLVSDSTHGLAAIIATLSRRDDLAIAAPIVRDFCSGASDLCLFGAGGSSLGAQAIAQFAHWRTPGHGNRVNGLGFHAFDNLDAETLGRALTTLDLARTRFLVVSKSGGTSETLIQALAAADALERNGLPLAKHFLVLTEATDNPLRRLGQKLGCPILEHERDIGGRFAVLTLVGMLPAMIFGLDPAAIRDGAAAVWQDFVDGADPANNPAIAGAALTSAAIRNAIFREFLLWPYADRLERFSAWWRQLFAESIGKDGKGAAATCALGPVDQHSQLQLFLDGPADRFITMIDAGRVADVPVSTRLAAEAGILLQRDEGPARLVRVQLRATRETLAHRGRPVRLLSMAARDEHSLGALFMHFMLEVILTCHLIDVDPFGQPAVEEGKVLARKYLAEGSE